MLVELLPVCDQTDFACIMQRPVVSQLSLCNGVRLVRGGIIDVLDCATRGTRQQGGETERDPSLVHFGQGHGALPAACPGEVAFRRTNRVDRMLDIAVPLERIPGEIEMSIDDQHENRFLTPILLSVSNWIP